MSPKSVFLIVLVATNFALFGCGGGGSHGRLTPQQRAVATARLNRAAFAVAGIGRRVTRGQPRRTRLIRILPALSRSRAVDQGYDNGLKLYWTLTTESDGSGRQDLFADEARPKPGGFFQWPAPEWSGGQAGSFPAVFHSTYEITAGEHPGLSGTMDMTLDDSTGENGHIHLILVDSFGERSEADFDVRNGKIVGRQRCSLSDGTTYDEVDEFDPNGGCFGTITFGNGSTAQITTDADGSARVTIFDAYGEIQDTGTVNDDGVGSFGDSSGGSEMIDVDTGHQESDSSSDDVWRGMPRKP